MRPLFHPQSATSFVTSQTSPASAELRASVSLQPEGLKKFSVCPILVGNPRPWHLASCHPSQCRPLRPPRCVATNRAAMVSDARRAWRSAATIVRSYRRTCAPQRERGSWSACGRRSLRLRGMQRRSAEATSHSTARSGEAGEATLWRTLCHSHHSQAHSKSS